MMWLGLALAMVFVLDAIRLRRRLAAFKEIPVNPSPTVPTHYHLIIAPGVVVHETTRQAATAFAHAQGLEVLDLVPENLPPLQIIELVQAIDPAAFRTDCFGCGRTAGHALLVTDDVLTRAQAKPLVSNDAVAFVRLAVKLKRYACTTTDLALMPGLQAVKENLDQRLAVLRAARGGLVLAALVGRPFVLVLLTVAIINAPLWGIFALLAYHTQALIIRRQRFRSADLLPVTLGRSLLELWRWLHTVFGRYRAPGEASAGEAKRPEYSALLADGVERFFEPRRQTCPLCGSKALRLMLRMPDLLQQKPGHFSLERCSDCGHIFQNPRLTVAGLNFYYQDFYDGLGGETFDFIFGRSIKGYLTRARLLVGRTEPTRWLDVGAGYGHFCCAARQVWPQSTFDGVDLSDGIEEAIRRRWVDTGYRGLFPELASQLTKRYDVVSMYHYLEHAREPQEEISAAHQVLSHDGYLLIEMPDPESYMGRLLGRFWLPWLQPQHQHLLSVENLDRLLRQQGFKPLMWQRGEPHQPADILFAIVILLGMLAPNPNSPWRPPASKLESLRYALVWTLGTPLALLGWALDFLLLPVFRRPKLSNCYRVLAQRCRNNTEAPQ